MSKPSDEPPAAHKVRIESGVVVLVEVQLPSGCWTMSLTLDTCEEVTDLPSRVIVTVSDAVTEDGRRAVVVKLTGLEQLNVDGVNVMLPEVELGFVELVLAIRSPISNTTTHNTTRPTAVSH